jgi:cytoskeletal protein CcmA (bactofilin family)
VICGAKATVQLDGHLSGNVSCVQLIVSKDAAVTGVIIAHEAVIRGKTTGIIRATRVLLQETAHVESEIIYQSLSVEEGVSFDGIARPRPDPLEEPFAVSPTPDSRQRIGEPDITGNGTGVDCETAAASGTRRQCAGPTAKAL